MLDEIASAIGAGLSYLANHADDPGAAFFPTPLLLSILQPFKENSDPRIDELASKAISIIKQDRQCNGAFNYWRRHTPERAARPYPDDLDDTALAYAALHCYSGNGLSGGDAARFIKLLISAEAAPGGPYNTWLLDFKSAPCWSDIDPAVNANIAFALQLMGVHMPALQRYLGNCLVTGTLKSRYYSSPLAVLYFISRAYRGTAASSGRQAILAARRGADRGTPLATACALSALLRWEENPQTLVPAVLSLLKNQAGGHWRAENLYIEGMASQKACFYKSSVLTTAFCLEALELARQHFLTMKAPAPFEITEPEVSDGPFQQETTKESQWIIGHPFWKESLDWARQARIALGEPADSISSDTLADLASAQLAGLSGYGIIDDIIDRQRSITELPCALSAIRLCHSIYVRLLPEEAIINEIFSEMEIALDREAKGLLPEKQSKKSLGAALPVLAIAVLSGRTGSRLRSLADFFAGLFAARQWNDDAHDYEADWLAGRITRATARLRRLLPGDCQKQERQAVFWQRVFPEILEEIKTALASARASLAAAELPQPAYFRDLLAQQSEIIGNIETAYANTKLFLKEYWPIE